MKIANLRSPYDTLGGLVYFGRMIDKIRLHLAGKLPEGYIPYLGEGAGAFDARCCRFLSISYPSLVAEVKRGTGDEALLEWAFTQGRRPSEEEIEVWNAFVSKRGWRDAAVERLHSRLRAAGLPMGGVDGTCLTSFDYIDLDEERPPRFPAAS